jgi:hypothetical protein
MPNRYWLLNPTGLKQQTDTSQRSDTEAKPLKKTINYYKKERTE